MTTQFKITRADLITPDKATLAAIRGERHHDMPDDPAAQQNTTASAGQNREQCRERDHDHDGNCDRHPAKPAETALVNGVKYVITGRLNEASVIRRPNGSKMYLALPANDGKDNIYGANRYRIVRPFSYGEPFDDSSSKPADAHAAGAHTPGPWKAFKYPDCKTWTVAARESVASKIKTEADARLIAAAPEIAAERDRLREQVKTLLAELNQVLRHGSAGNEQLIRKAIASVESEEAK